jgi:hypothetical protein
VHSPTIYMCPMDDGTAVAISFSYPHAAKQVVVVQLDGCGFVSLTGTQRWSTTALRRELAPLAPPGWRSH